MMRKFCLSQIGTHLLNRQLDAQLIIKVGAITELSRHAPWVIFVEDDQRFPNECQGMYPFMQAVMQATNN